MQALMIRIGFFVLLFAALLTSVSAEDVLFDIDAASPHSSLPLDVTDRETPSREAATFLGYALQDADVLGCTPQGFAGRGVYRNSIDLDELLIRFAQVLTPFAIIYASQELGGNDAAAPRVSPTMSGPRAGTTTMTASIPGSWPSDTLGCTFPEGFDSVIVPFDNRPPTCQHDRVNVMAGTIRAAPTAGSGVSGRGDDLPSMSPAPADSPNPFNPEILIEQTFPAPGMVSVQLFSTAFGELPPGNIACDVVTNAELTMERLGDMCRPRGETHLEAPCICSQQCV